jgi:Xaa-Pro aminopeptidase
MYRLPSILIVILAFAGVVRPSAQIPQGLFTDTFPKEEFAARRAKVFEAIGDGVAIMQGAVEKSAELPFRQGAQFFYLTGVEVPRAILVMDGRIKQSTLYVPAAGFRLRALGPSIVPGEEAVRATGLSAVLPREAFADAVAAIGRDKRTIFTPAADDPVGGGSRGEMTGLANATRNDPWDGRESRETAFLAKLKSAMNWPDLTVQNLDPIIDRLRSVKSAREIAVIREATKQAGDGIMEAMREAEPGMYEYELQAVAEYVFKKGGSQGPAYFALVATGPNMPYSHYHKGTRKLADGDLVQFDYAPDYQYYVSDVTRVFPANGKFTMVQREFYTVYLRMYQALMSVIKPNVPVSELLHEAGRKMLSIVEGMTFANPQIKASAMLFANRYATGTGTSFGHSIGLEVHDVGRGRPPEGTPVTLVPGQLFTIEPAMQVPALGLAMRLEDALLVTETGYENLSAFVPLEINAIEKLMTEPGISALIKNRKR